MFYSSYLKDISFSNFIGMRYTNIHIQKQTKKKLREKFFNENTIKVLREAEIHKTKKEMKILFLKILMKIQQKEKAFSCFYQVYKILLKLN